MRPTTACSTVCTRRSVLKELSPSAPPAGFPEEAVEFRADARAVSSQAGAEGVVAQAAGAVDARTLDPWRGEEATPIRGVRALVETGRQDVAVEPRLTEIGKIQGVVGIDLEDVVDRVGEVRESGDVDEAARVEVAGDLRVAQIDEQAAGERDLEQLRGLYPSADFDSRSQRAKFRIFGGAKHVGPRSDLMVWLHGLLFRFFAKAAARRTPRYQR